MTEYNACHSVAIRLLMRLCAVGIYMAQQAFWNTGNGGSWIYFSGLCPSGETNWGKLSKVSI